MSWGRKNLTRESKISNERKYELIRRPIVTEKSTLASEHNALTFEVPLNASKSEIKLAVEELFKVKVKKVNTLRLKGKTKRFRGHFGQRSDFKKAMVTLEEGQSVDISTGI